MTRIEVAEVEQLEHLSTAQGENINAKRGALFGYDYGNSQWRRVSVNASGELLLV